MKLSKILLGASALVMALSLNACGKQVALKDNSGLKQYTYTNGNQITNIGDPYLFTYDGKYYCTATESGTYYGLYESEDLNSWNRLTNIFYCSGTEGWVRGSLWQPQIVVGNDGKFYLYYCGQNDDKSLRIGVAVSDVLTGPYTDVHGAPLFDLGYANIDPNFYTDDDGRMYLYYSRDCSENVVDNHHVSQIYVVEMEDYTHVKEDAEHILCITPQQPWELLNNADYQWNCGWWDEIGSFAGSFDDVYVFNKSLSQSEVKDVMNAKYSDMTSSGNSQTVVIVVVVVAVVVVAAAVGMIMMKKKKSVK